MGSKWLPIPFVLAVLGLAKYSPFSEKFVPRERMYFKVCVVSVRAGSNCRIPPEESPTGDDVWRGALWGCEKDSTGLCRLAGSENLKGTEFENLQFHSDRSGALFDLIPENDCKDEDHAARLVEKIRQDPMVLAVIGLSTSRTTRRVAESFAQAGIPLIMPEATAASAAMRYSGKGEDSGRLPNYVRLQPSDDQAQAPAVVQTILRLRARDGRVFLRASGGAQAEGYAKGLVGTAKSLLHSQDVRLEEVSASADDSVAVRELVKKAGANDLVFFAGYQEQARDFLEGLDKGFGESRTAQQRPIVVLPEACDGLETESRNIRVYRTGPADTTACAHGLKQDAVLRKWRRTNTSDPLPIGMLYGHDAVQLLSRALRGCQAKGNRISRRCVLEQLRATVASGACGGYSFRGGENLLSSYYVFRSRQARALFRSASPGQESLDLPFEVTPVEIIRVQDVAGGR